MEARFIAGNQVGDLAMGLFGDYVEVLESAEKPGVKGRVVAINMLYTTLEDISEGNAGALLQIPNSLFFQKIIRRWRGANGPLPLADNE